MHNLCLNLVLLTISFLPFLTAEHLLRTKAPAPTIAPLLIRQDMPTCAAGATSCHDNQPGCCEIGSQCTSDENHIPICQGFCDGGPTCSGAFSGHCCNLGLTCNYELTLCETQTLGFSDMSLTGDLLSTVSHGVTSQTFPASAIASSLGVPSTPTLTPFAPADTGVSPAIAPGSSSTRLQGSMVSAPVESGDASMIASPSSSPLTGIGASSSTDKSSTTSFAPVPPTTSATTLGSSTTSGTTLSTSDAGYAVVLGTVLFYISLGIFKVC